MTRRGSSPALPITRMPCITVSSSRARARGSFSGASSPWACARASGLMRLDAEALERSSMLRRLALYRIGAGIALTAMLLAALATLSGVAMGRPLIEGLLAAAALHP